MNALNFFTCWLFLTVSAFLLSTTAPTHADDMYIWAEEAGGGVTLHFQGSIDLAGLGAAEDTVGSAGIAPSAGVFFCAGVTVVPVDSYPGAVPESGEKVFGTGGSADADSVSVSAGGFGFNGNRLYVPDGYPGNSQFSGSMTFNGATLASLGLDLTPKTFNTTGDGNTIHLMVNPNPPEVDNSAAILDLQRTIRKLKKKVRKAEKQGQLAKAKKLKRRLKKLRRKLRRLG